jgi:hypothetical protein
MCRTDDSIDVDDEGDDSDELQKRARRQSGWIQRRLRLLRWLVLHVCMCFRTLSDPVYKHVKDTCDLFLFEVSIYMFRYPNSDRTHPVPANMR